MVDKKETWTRSLDFKKYFGTVFGITQAGDSYRLDIGNERIQIKKDELVNVADCQIILPQESFNVLLGLLNRIKKLDDKTKSGSKKAKSKTKK